MPTPATTLPAKPLPPDRTLSYPFVGFDIVQDDIGKVGDENQIGRTEDLYFGTEVTGEIGYSDAVFGANHDALMLAARAVHGFEVPVRAAAVSELGFLLARRERSARNLISDAARGTTGAGARTGCSMASLSGTVTHSLDPDVQLACWAATTGCAATRCATSRAPRAGY